MKNIVQQLKRPKCIYVKLDNFMMEVDVVIVMKPVKLAQMNSKLPV